MNNRRFSDSFKAKVLSFFVAFGMWVFIMEKTDPIRVESIENIPISRIENLDEIKSMGLAVSNNQNTTVNIDFRGRRSALLNYLRKDIELRATIENPKIGENKLTLFITSPDGIEFSFDRPSYYIELEESIVSKKNIQITTTGNPNDDFIIKSIVPDKTDVYVEGAKTQVDKVVKVIGQIDTTGVKQDYSIRVKLSAVDKNDNEVEGVSLEKGSILVNISVEQMKEVPIQLVFVDQNGEKIENDSFAPSSKSVKVVGKPSIVNSIDVIYSQNIKVEDFNRYMDSGIDLKSDSGIRLSFSRVDVVPISENEKDYEFVIPKENVIISSDAPKDEILEKLPDVVYVNFSSSKSYNDKLSEDNINLVINNTDTEVYEIIAEIRYPVRGLSVSPNQIKVEEGE